GGVHGLRGRADVDETAADPVAQAGSLRYLLRVGVVDVDQLEVRRVLGPPAQQLELDVADATADLEDRRAVDAAAGEEVDDAGRGLVETAFPVPGPQVPGEPGTEHVVAPTGVTAAAHDRSIAGSGTRVSPRTDDPRPARGTTLAAIVASP